MYSALDGMIQKKEKGELVFLKSGEPKMIENKILKLADKWENDEDKWHYVSRVYKTMEILQKVLDKEQFIKYHLKSKRELVDVLFRDVENEVFFE
jgi:hypothetical protein